MTKTAKRLLAVLLSVLMCGSVLTSLPATAFAAEATGNAGAESGTTGDCTWTLDDNGVLTISVDGDMWDYDPYFSSPHPWGWDIVKVVIEDGVTSIGEEAFNGCESLTSVTIPDSVTSIGSGAFEGCESLTSVTIPDSVTSIGSCAFEGCKSLTSVTIPDSVTSIGSCAFEGCKSLTSVTIPDSVTSIGNAVFRSCSCLTSISVAENNTVYDSRNHCNAMIETATDTLLFGCQNTVIPDSVTSIGNYAFYGCTGLTSVTIPDSVTSIGNYAFYGCIGLTSVTIPDSVTSIGNYAFQGCKNLTSFTIPDSVTSIGENVFYGCTGLTSVTIPDSVTSIGRSAFYNTAWYNDQPDGLVYAGKVAYQYKGTMPSGTSITLQDGTKGIADYAFYGCTGLTSVTIPDSVTSIGRSAFCNTAWYNNQPDGLVYAGKVAYQYKGTMPSGTSITLQDGTKGIADYAFYGCTGLTSVTIPDSVTSIGKSAFRDCEGLTSVTIPNSVTSIGNSAFQWCTSLTSVTIPDSVTSIGDIAFGYYDYDLKPFDSFTIYGTKGSAAEAYANENGFTFVDEAAPSALIGDIDGDGKVNGADAGLLSRYTSGWDGYEAKVKNMDAADINGDGKVNGADAGLLSRYTSGWDSVKKYFAA